jgi:hypothetical protein
MREKLDLWDVLAAAGMALMALGAGMIYVPVGVIAGGLGLCLWAFVGAMAKRRV